MFRRTVSLILSFTFICQQSVYAAPAVFGTVAQAGVSGNFRPVLPRSVVFDPLSRDFRIAMDKGDARAVSDEDTRKLSTYFRIGLALPNDAFWVNLRPDGQTRMIDPELEKTDLGRVLLEADVQLKKDLAGLTSPATPAGREYWDKLYAKAETLMGQDAVEIPTLSRPWIVPAEVLMVQDKSKNGAFVYKATLKVMLEQDYLKDSPVYDFKDARKKELNEYSARLIRETIIPRLNVEVNSAARYAGLRQVYYSLVLAQWSKQQAISGSPDTRDLSGLTSKDRWSKETYFEQYRTSFRDGEYNLSENRMGHLRTFFSGGCQLFNAVPLYKNTLSAVMQDGGALFDGGLPDAKGISSAPVPVDIVFDSGIGKGTVSGNGEAGWSEGGRSLDLWASGAGKKAWYDYNFSRPMDLSGYDRITFVMYNQVPKELDFYFEIFNSVPAKGDLSKADKYTVPEQTYILTMVGSVPITVEDEGRLGVEVSLADLASRGIDLTRVKGFRITFGQKGVLRAKDIRILPKGYVEEEPKSRIRAALEGVGAYLSKKLNDVRGNEGTAKDGGTAGEKAVLRSGQEADRATAERVFILLQKMWPRIIGFDQKLLDGTVNLARDPAYILSEEVGEGLMVRSLVKAEDGRFVMSDDVRKSVLATVVVEYEKDGSILNYRLVNPVLPVKDIMKSISTRQARREQGLLPHSLVYIMEVLNFKDRVKAAMQEQGIDLKFDSPVNKMFFMKTKRERAYIFCQLSRDGRELVIFARSIDENGVIRKLKPSLDSRGLHGKLVKDKYDHVKLFITLPDNLQPPENDAAKDGGKADPARVRPRLDAIAAEVRDNRLPAIGDETILGDGRISTLLEAASLVEDDIYIKEKLGMILRTMPADGHASAMGAAREAGPDLYEKMWIAIGYVPSEDNFAAEDGGSTHADLQKRILEETAIKSAIENLLDGNRTSITGRYPDMIAFKTRDGRQGMVAFYLDVKTRAVNIFAFLEDGAWLLHDIQLVLKELTLGPRRVRGTSGQEYIAVDVPEFFTPAARAKDGGTGESGIVHDQSQAADILEDLYLNRGYAITVNTPEGDKLSMCIIMDESFTTALSQQILIPMSTDQGLAALKTELVRTQRGDLIAAAVNGDFFKDIVGAGAVPVFDNVAPTLLRILAYCLEIRDIKTLYLLSDSSAPLDPVWEKLGFKPVPEGKRPALDPKLDKADCYSLDLSDAASRFAFGVKRSVKQPAKLLARDGGDILPAIISETGIRPALEDLLKAQGFGLSNSAWNIILLRKNGEQGKIEFSLNRARKAMEVTLTIDGEQTRIDLLALMQSEIRKLSLPVELAAPGVLSVDAKEFFPVVQADVDKRIEEAWKRLNEWKVGQAALEIGDREASKDRIRMLLDKSELGKAIRKVFSVGEGYKLSETKSISDPQFVFYSESTKMSGDIRCYLTDNDTSIGIFVNVFGGEQKDRDEIFWKVQTAFRSSRSIKYIFVHSWNQKEFILPLYSSEQSVVARRDGGGAARSNLRPVYDGGKELVVLRTKIDEGLLRDGVRSQVRGDKIILFKGKMRVGRLYWSVSKPKRAFELRAFNTSDNAFIGKLKPLLNANDGDPGLSRKNIYVPISRLKTAADGGGVDEAGRERAKTLLGEYFMTMLSAANETAREARQKQLLNEFRQDFLKREFELSDDVLSRDNISFLPEERFVEMARAMRRVCGDEVTSDFLIRECLSGFESALNLPSLTVLAEINNEEAVTAVETTLLYGQISDDTRQHPLLFLDRSIETLYKMIGGEKMKQFIDSHNLAMGGGTIKAELYKEMLQKIAGTQTGSARDGGELTVRGNFDISFVISAADRSAAGQFVEPQKIYKKFSNYGTKVEIYIPIGFRSDFGTCKITYDSQNPPVHIDHWGGAERQFNQLVEKFVAMLTKSTLMPAQDGGTGAPAETGGIDFRSIPISSRPAEEFLKALFGNTGGAVRNLDGEFERINGLFRMNIAPSAQRLKEFVVSCCINGELKERAPQALDCIARLLAAQESKAESADADTKALLVLLSGT